MLRMSRVLLLAVFAAIFIGGCGAQDVEKWDAFLPAGKTWRGPGSYLSWVKIVLCWAVFLAWVWTTDWVSRDLQEHKKLKYLRWNPIVFGTFMAAFVLVWFLPYFWVGFPLLVVAYVAPLTTYIIQRNARVEISQRVLTREHIRYWLSHRFKKVGVKIAAEKPDPHETGPPVKLFGRGGPSPSDDAGRLLAARQHPGLRAVREIIAAGLACRGAAIMLDYAPEGAGVRYLVDGVWLNRDPLERETADPALEALKTLCGLDPQDRQTRREGTFAAEHNAVRYAATLACQGIPTGERAAIHFEQQRVRFENLEALGMRAKMQEQLNELLDRTQGFLLFSALPAGGLRSTMAVALRGTDRLTRDFLAVEDEGNRYEEVENVPVTTYKSAAGESPITVLPKVVRAEPNVLVVRDLVNAETINFLCREVAPERLVISSMRAKDAAEALLRVLALKAAAADFAKAALAVLSQRLIRKLCEDCKEAYTPAPEVLKQLGIPEGRIPAFYRPPEPPADPDEAKKYKPCPKCGGVGYVGRTAIFELLVLGDLVRKALAASPKLELLRSAARKDGMRILQEEGVVLVAKGVTSLPELMRVLKQ